jgi:hypothetical protein
MPLEDRERVEIQRLAVLATRSATITLNDHRLTPAIVAVQYGTTAIVDVKHITTTAAEPLLGRVYVSTSENRATKGSVRWCEAPVWTLACESVSTETVPYRFICYRHRIYP